MVLHRNLVTDNLHIPKDHTHVEADITDLDKYTQAEVNALIAAGTGTDPNAVHLNEANEFSAVAPFPAVGDGWTLLSEADAASLYIKGRISLAQLRTLYLNSYYYTQAQVNSLISGISLDELDDTTGISALSGNDLLFWDAGNNEWANASFGALGLATLDDVQAPEYSIPHYSKGSGDLGMTCVHSLGVATDSTDNTLTQKVSCADVIVSLQGGVASPTYTFQIKKLGDAYGAGGSDPTAEYVEYDDTDAGSVVFVVVQVSDGTNTAEQTSAVSVNDRSTF